MENNPLKIQTIILFLLHRNQLCVRKVEIVRHCPKKASEQLSPLSAHLMGFFVRFFSSHRAQLFRCTAYKMRVIVGQWRQKVLARNLFCTSKQKQIARQTFFLPVVACLLPCLLMIAYNAEPHYLLNRPAMYCNQ